MDSSKALSVSDLRKTYANGLKALDGVSLDVEKGEFFALLGPNGAGKSTLIGIVCSLVNKDGGRVTVFGEDLALHPGRVKSHIGLVPQEFNFNMWETPWAILLNQAGYYGIDRATATAALRLVSGRADLDPDSRAQIATCASSESGKSASAGPGSSPAA